MLPTNHGQAENINQLMLAIGNSRLHWAWLKESLLVEVWDTPHLSNEIISDLLPQKVLSNNFAQQNLTNISVCLASVVPKQAKTWENYSNLNVISLKDIKLKNIYSTMGIDRALSLWGGAETYGYPCLVIDGGTALTFTGVDKQKQLIGGAILPGLRSQFLTLNQKTAALPEVKLPATLPLRWALDTEKAIASGIIYTTIVGIYSYITDWQQQHPQSQIILTGGDGEILLQYLTQQYPELKSIIKCDRNLIFYGMKLAVVSKH